MSRAAAVALGIWEGLSELAAPRALPATPASFEERERIRRGRLLARFLVISLLLDSAFFAGCLRSQFLAPYAYPVSVGIALQIACLFPNWLGRTELACLLYVVATLTTCVLSLVFAPFDTVYAGLIIYRFYVTAVVQAGFLISRRAPVYVALITVALFAAHVFLNQRYYSALPLVGAYSMVTAGVFAVTVMISIAMITGVIAASIERAVAQADRAEEVEKVYRDLQESHESLEASAREVQERADKLAELNAQLRAVQDQILHSYRRLEEVNRNLQLRADTDSLTGLANYRAFHDMLEVEVAMAASEGAALSLLMIDVDGFKEYNDRHGHLAGDEVLRGVGQALNEKLRETDLAARYGGDEFVVLLGQTPVSSAYQAAERIRRTISAYPFPHGQVTVSIGIAAVGAETRDPESLVREADSALYAAKQAGKNRVIIGSMPPLDLDGGVPLLEKKSA